MTNPSTASDDGDLTIRCEACGEPATQTDIEGVPLCEGDYQDLLLHWRMEGFDQLPNPTPRKPPASRFQRPSGYRDTPEPSTGLTDGVAGRLG